MYQSLRCDYELNAQEYENVVYIQQSANEGLLMLNNVTISPWNLCIIRQFYITTKLNITQWPRKVSECLLRLQRSVCTVSKKKHCNDVAM